MCKMTIQLFFLLSQINLDHDFLAGTCTFKCILLYANSTICAFKLSLEKRNNNYNYDLKEFLQKFHFDFRFLR